MDSNLILSHAKFLYYSSTYPNLKLCVEQAIDKLVKPKDICELNHNIGCSLDEFKQDIYSNLFNDIVKEQDSI